jgi:hypothetical protein
MPAIQATKGGGDGDPQRLTDTEQLELLGLLEAASSPAMRPGRVSQCWLTPRLGSM